MIPCLGNGALNSGLAGYPPQTYPQANQCQQSPIETAFQVDAKFCPVDIKASHHTTTQSLFHLAISTQSCLQSNLGSNTLVTITCLNIKSENAPFGNGFFSSELNAHTSVGILEQDKCVFQLLACSSSLLSYEV